MLKIKLFGAHISFRALLFFVFCFSFFILLSIIVGVNYMYNSRSSIDTAQELMEKTSSEIFMKIENLYKPIFYITDQASGLPVMMERATIQNHPAEKFFLNTLKTYPQIETIYFGYPDGEFYEIMSFIGNYGDVLKESVGAPENSSFAILRQFTPPGQDSPVRLWKYIDSVYRATGSRKVLDVTYDPRTRPWYKQAMSSAKSERTAPYQFANVDMTGITISKKIEGSRTGVLGVDVLIDELSVFLEELSTQSSGLVLFYNEKLEVTTAPYYLTQTYNFKPNTSFSDTGVPLLKVISDEVLKKNIMENSSFTVKLDNKRYYLKTVKLPKLYSKDEHVLIAISEKEILKSVSSIALKSMLISLVITLLSIPISLILSQFITSPLNSLVEEAEKIGKFELDGELDVSTNIVEVVSLSKEMASMKRGLRYFNRYVPSKLVRKLVESGQGAEIGGALKEMTLLFTDIESFTTISEGISADKLMVYLSDYFNVLSTEILRTNGTIDKYIGDAVMAFWNAPTDIAFHQEQACSAALNIKKTIEKFAPEWKAMNIPVFKTRIGIHSGVAVVGNVGSAERMNYTAIGDVVNNCSRLEGLNKIYGTEIIISDTVAKNLGKKYLYRPLEKVVPKGKTTVETIYELVNYRDESSSSEIDFVEYFTKAFEAYHKRKWKKALYYFVSAGKINSKDKILFYYIRNCRAYLKEEPSNDWNGVRLVRSK
ncbi:MAG: adenylate/guanylate cyclase domain-containing protein [Spirochaetales bacterium]|nr:adenylate/guanylate cyclase domain-containing protein [Spirochaetales bacterium]